MQPTISRRNLGAMALAAAAMGASGVARAQAKGTIKLGILHSLSGTMAISETT